MSRLPHFLDNCFTDVSHEYGEVYAGQTGQTTEIRYKEHTRHIYLGWPEKSAVAEHKFEMGHNIEFGNTTILGKAPGYMDHTIKEAIEIRLHPRNFNMGGGFNPIPGAW
jgi:hypothetical protein